MGQKISPNRRRSIAVLNQGQPSRHSGRRRAYSIAPGEKLSPAAKARRSLAPRKSILKAANLPDSTVSSALGDETTAQSMDFTEVHSQNPRKSLARRVSFASHAHVRLFEIQEQNTNSSAEPASSPSQDSSPAARGNGGDENVDPNGAQAGRRSIGRRRSSTAFSEFGEQSMDMDMDDTAPLPQDFLGQNRGQIGESAVEDDEFTDEDDEDDDDMEITEAIRMSIERKRSLSLGQGRASLPGRRRSSVAPMTASRGQSENQPPSQLLRRPPLESENALMQDDEQDLTTSSAQSESYVSEESSGDVTQPMEFTIPISRSLRPPEPPSDAWLQLRAMTHAGDAPYEPPPPDGSDDDGMSMPVTHVEDGGDAMELTDAVERLLKARSSLGLAHISGPLTGPGTTQTESDLDDVDALVAQEQQFQDDTFTSTEDSFTGDVGDRTVNVTSLIRASLGGQDSSMDATSTYAGTGEDDRVVNLPVGASTGSSSPHPAQSTNLEPSPPAPPTSSDASTSLSSVFSAPQSARPSVFSAAGSKTPSQVPRSPSKGSSVTIPKPFTFGTSRPSTPSARTSTAAPIPGPPNAPPSPAITPQRQRNTAAFAPPSVGRSPLKRPAAPASDGGHQPSPAKRLAIGKLEPSKKAPFEKTAQLQGNRRASMIRRPSGYFAQRKSLGVGMLPSGPAGNSTSGRPGSPRKVAGQGLGRGRASVGSLPSGQGLRLPPEQESSSDAPLYPDVERIMREDPPTPSRTRSPKPASEKECDREAFRQAIASPSPTRGSPSPASPQPKSPVVAAETNVPQRPISPAVMEPRVRSPANVPPRAVSPANIVLRPSSPGIPPRTTSPMSQALPPDVSSSTGIALQHSTEPEGEVNMTVATLTATQQWRDDIQEEDLGYNDEEPPISIEQFFDMTGIRFMDELTMPKPRQSMGPPPQVRSRTRRRSSTDINSDPVDEDPISLAEFSVAMAVELPRLELFAAVTNDLTAWIEESKKICLQAEKETEKVTPELFRDFVSADDSEKSILIHQLKLIKANNYGTAKSQWYDWKTVWTEQLYTKAEQEFTNLESDAQALAKIIKQAQGILPDLRAEYAQVMSELQQEQADVADIENSDQDFLNELKTTIAEQSSELEAFKTDVSEGRAKLERLQEKLADIETQKQETAGAIAQSQHIIHIQKESTSVEVFRLKDELEALQDLHLWQATKMVFDLTQFVYASRYQVTIPCIKYKPILGKASVCRAPHARRRERDPFPQLTDLALLTAQQLVTGLPDDTSIREIVERLSDFWASCSQLRSQFAFLAVKYPLVVEAISTGETTLPHLHAKATVLFPSVRGKACISFVLDSNTYSHWPISINALKTDVAVVYGPLQRDPILNAVRQRLDQASPVDNHGCLLDACIEAAEQYIDV